MLCPFLINFKFSLNKILFHIIFITKIFFQSLFYKINFLHLIKVKNIKISFKYYNSVKLKYEKYFIFLF
jgi:hypothetical protein